MTAELEWCSEASGEAKCLEEDTLIVLAYAAFCVALGLVVALLVIWADKARGSKTRAKVADNVEVIGNMYFYTTDDSNFNFILSRVT